MSKETIMLAKDYDISKFEPGCFVSRKLDGVPVRIDIVNGAVQSHATRQGEELKSIDHILTEAARILPDGIWVGELYIPHLPFKDISGRVRAHVPCPELILYLYDVITEEPYAVRYERLLNIERGTMIRSVYDMWDAWNTTHQIFHVGVLESLIAWAASTAGVEGLVIRPSQSYPDGPGKRSKGFLRYKPKPTLDLAVAGFEEAVSKDGAPLGMVGKVLLHYKGGIIGCGPGKLTHIERTEIFNDQDKYKGRIAEIQYMRDDTYTALRQPTFQHWRPDKTEADC